MVIYLILVLSLRERFLKMDQYSRTIQIFEKDVYIFCSGKYHVLRG